MGNPLKIFISIFITFALIVPAMYAQEEKEEGRKKTDREEIIQIVSVNDVKNLMTEKFESIEDYTAEFVWINGDAHYNGEIKYKKPDRILLNFKEPQNQKIVVNNENLYIYIPSLKVLCQQSLSEDTESTILTTTSESGLSRMFDDYSLSFYDTSSLEIFRGVNAYHLKLMQTKPKVGFKSMDLWVSSNGLVLQSNGISPSGMKVSLTFSNIKINTEIPDYMFTFDIPPDVQIMRNIIIPFAFKE